MSLAELSLAQFLDELASASPAPGGGSAAAYAGALGAALVAMVCRLTIGRKNYESVHAELQEILLRAEELEHALLDLVQADADAYHRVMEAYRLSKTREQDRIQRETAIQDALKHAAQVPFEVATLCAQVVELSQIVAAKGNKNATSDAATGRLCAEAGMHAAILNVETNLGLIHDSAFVQQMRVQLEVLKQPNARRREILKAVEARM